MESKNAFRVLRTQPVSSGLGTWAIPNALRRIKELGAEVVVGNDETEEGVIEAIKKYSPVHIILTTYGKITNNVLEAGFPHLKAIVKSGTGIDNIDFPACKEKGIPVTNIPDYGAAAVAENALLLLITLSRNYNTIVQETLKTGWCDPDIPYMKGNDLFQKKMGLVGLGHIGSHFAMIALGFGMEVRAFDVNLTAEQMERLAVRKIDSLEQLCSTCDVIGIFLPLNEDTKGLISRDLISKFQKHTLLINVSRGAICDERALAEALREGRIGGLGLDVFSDEPIRLDPNNSEKNKSNNIFSSLIGHPRLTITPHCAGWTEECWEVVEFEAVARVQEIIEGREITIKSADPRLQNQDELGCYYPNKPCHSKSNSTMSSIFDFPRSSLPLLLEKRRAEAAIEINQPAN